MGVWNAPAYPAMIPLYIWFIFVLSSVCLCIIVADAQIFSVVSSSETEVTLVWFSEYRNSNCSYILWYFNEGWWQIPQQYQDSVILTYRVQFLSPGTRYYFVLDTIFEGTWITRYTSTAVTSKLLFFSFFNFGLDLFTLLDSLFLFYSSIECQPCECDTIKWWARNTDVAQKQWFKIQLCSEIWSLWDFHQGYLWPILYSDIHRQLSVSWNSIYLHSLHCVWGCEKQRIQLLSNL